MMRRGKSQALFRCLPECVIDHSDSGTIVKVSKWNSIEATDINKSKVVREIEKRIPPLERRIYFAGGEDQYVFLEARNFIEVDLFPLVFRCNKCDKIYSFQSISQLEYLAGNKLECTKDGCKGNS